MAIAFEIIFDIEDESGKDSTFSLFVPTSFTISDYIEAAIGIGEFIDILLHGKFRSIADLCLNVDLSALTGNTEDVDSDVEEIASFQFETVDDRHVALNIPCLDETVVLPATKELDQTAPAVASVIALMETGVAVTGGQILPCDIGEIDINDTDYARERTRNSGTAA